MTNINKIKELIYSFSQAEKKELIKYVQLNHSKSILIHFFNLIVEDKKFDTNQELFQKLYKGDIYNDIRIRKLFSRAKTVLIEFSAHLKSKNEIIELKAHSLLSSRTNIGLVKELTKKIKSKTETNYSSQFFQFELDLANGITHEILQHDKRTIEPKFQEAHNALDDKFLIDKLKLACSSLSYTNLSGHEYNLKLLDELEPFLILYSKESKSVLYLFYHTYLMIKYKNKEDFQLLFDFLSSEFIPTNDDYKEIFTMCINHCIQMLNHGDRTILDKLFKLYQLQIQSKNIYNNDKLFPTGYKNISNLAIQLKEYTWAEEFIESHKNKIQSPHPDEDYQFVKARYYYETENYEKCIQLIAISRPQDMLNNLSMRILQCKAYYQLDEYEMIDLTIHNALIYLLRNKSNTYQIQIFKNFFKILKKILQSSQTKKGTEKLLAEISETKLLAERAWLLKLF